MTEPLLLAGREAQLRRELHDVRRPQLRRLLEECERLRGEVLPTEPPNASITYFGPASANLALAYRLTGQEHYLTELRRYLAPPLSFPHWGKAHMPDHDLDAAWLLHGLALAYSWAGDALPEDERAALRDKLILQGTRMYDFARRSPRAAGGPRRTGRTTTGSATPGWPPPATCCAPSTRRRRPGPSGPRPTSTPCCRCSTRTDRTTRASCTGATASRGSSATSTSSRRPRASTGSRVRPTCARRSGTGSTRRPRTWSASSTTGTATTAAADTRWPCTTSWPPSTGSRRPSGSPRRSPPSSSGARPTRAGCVRGSVRRPTRSCSGSTRPPPRPTSRTLPTSRVLPRPRPPGGADLLGRRRHAGLVQVVTGRRAQGLGHRAPHRRGDRLDHPQRRPPPPGLRHLRHARQGRLPGHRRGILLPQAHRAPQRGAGRRSGLRQRGPLPHLRGTRRRAHRRDAHHDAERGLGARRQRGLAACTTRPWVSSASAGTW